MVETVNNSSIELFDLRVRHRKLIRELHDAVLERNKLRLILLSGVMDANRRLQRDLSRQPVSPTSHYWTTFGDHWSSFALFNTKTGIACKQLSIPIDIESPILDESDTIDEDRWEDLIDEMEEELHKLRMGRDSRKQLLIVVELIDSAERLSTLEIPGARGKGKKFTEALQNMRRSVKFIADCLKEILSQQEVTQVSPLTGEYPQPEKTRIISRNDSNTDDNVAVKEVVLNGYMWRGKMLRKADVIVTSNEGD